MGRFDFTATMDQAWRVFNNMFVSLQPLVSGVVGIALLVLAVGGLFYLVRKASS